MRILKNAESLEVVERVLTAKRKTIVWDGFEQYINIKTHPKTKQKINLKTKPEIEIRAISAPNFYLWFLCHFWWFV